MEKIIVPCPTCGALGEEGTECQFCGMLIQPSESVNKKLQSRIVKTISVSSDVFTERISKYHSVGGFVSPGVSIVRIGSLFGMINRNGDIIVPLLYSQIEIIKSRWAIVREDDEIKLIDLVSWVPINWKAKEEYEDYSVSEGFNNQLLITRGYYRTRKIYEPDDKFPWIAAWTEENVFMPLFCVYDINTSKTILEGEGEIHKCKTADVYITHYKYQKDDEGYSQPLEMAIGNPHPPKAIIIRGKIDEKSMIVSPEGKILFEMKDIQVREEDDGFSVFVQDGFFNNLRRITISERKKLREKLQTVHFNPLNEGSEQATLCQESIKKELQAIRRLNEEREGEIKEAENQKISKMQQIERRRAMFPVYFVIGLLAICVIAIIVSFFLD